MSTVGLTDNSGAVASLGETEPLLAETARPIRLTAGRSSACERPWLLDRRADHLAPVKAWTGTVDRLPDVYFGCGDVMAARFFGQKTTERALFFGDLSFDTRVAAAELAVIRTTIEDYFGIATKREWLWDVAVVRDRGSFEGSVRARAVETGLHVQIPRQAGWGAKSRIVVARTIAAQWLRRALARNEVGGLDTTEGEALITGIAHAIARDELLALGLLGPDDYAEDLTNAQAALAQAATVRQSLMAGSAELGDVVPIDVRIVVGQHARHSLEAAAVAWGLRARGEDSNLYHRLAAEPGIDIASLWDGIRRRAGARKLPQRLGRCYRARPTKHESEIIGLALEHRGIDRRLGIVGVRTGSPAARAGVTVGDELESFGRLDGADDARYGLVVVHDGARVFSPVEVETVRTRGYSWRRLRIPDLECLP